MQNYQFSAPASGEAPAAAVYVLLLNLRQPVRRRIGALGIVDLPPGGYVYVGSAQEHAERRIRRHFRTRKPVRWHIDHLTGAPGIEPVGAVLFTDEDLGECALNQQIGRLTRGRVPVPRFGASDCKARCPAHLWYTPNPLNPAEVTLGRRHHVLWPDGTTSRRF